VKREFFVLEGVFAIAGTSSYPRKRFGGVEIEKYHEVG
jgi:hypothetical protein